MLPHVAIATPMYDGKVTEHYMRSVILSMQDPRHVTSFRLLPGDSLVCRARNTLLTQVWNERKQQGLTHLLWQDADVFLPHGAIASMLSRDVDVVASPVPMKVPIGRHGWVQSIVGIQAEIEPMFYTARYAATGCLMFSMDAVSALVDYCETMGHVTGPRDARQYDAFRIGADGNGFYLSEDWYVCKVLREIGFDIYVDSSFPVTHVESPRVWWTRPAVPLAETILAGDYAGSLPEDARDQRWATNDYDLTAAVL